MFFKHPHFQLNQILPGSRGVRVDKEVSEINPELMSTCLNRPYWKPRENILNQCINWHSPPMCPVSYLFMHLSTCYRFPSHYSTLKVQSHISVFLAVLYIYTQSNISLYHRTQSAVWPILTGQVQVRLTSDWYSPNWKRNTEGWLFINVPEVL